MEESFDDDEDTFQIIEEIELDDDDPNMGIHFSIQICSPICSS